MHPSLNKPFDSGVRNWWKLAAPLLVASAAFAAASGTLRAQSLSSQLKREGVAALVQAAQAKGDAVRGAVLFPQQKLGCANCHAARGKDLLGPDLTRLGREATGDYLVESLLEPSKVVKKGFESTTIVTSGGKVLVGRVIEQGDKVYRLRVTSTDAAAGSGNLVILAKADVEQILENKTSAMPDDLVDQLANRQQFLDLVRYLMALAAAGPHTAGEAVVRSAGRSLPEVLRGLVLLDKHQCGACHGDVATRGGFPPQQAPDLTWSAGKIDPRYIERFIADPHNVKPGTTMPNLMYGLEPQARREAAKAIAHYVTAKGGMSFERQTTDAEAADRGRELFHSVGCVACHSPRDDEGKETLAETSVPLGRLGQKYNLEGLVALLKDPHAVRPSGRMPNMQLTHWEALDIAHYLIQSSDNGQGLREPFSIDRDLAEEGKKQFRELGCIACHGEDGVGAPQNAPRLVPQRSGQGCLSGEAGQWPRYSLSESDRIAMQAAIGRRSEEFTDEQQIDVTLAVFNCVACHRRGDLGGVSDERDAFFHSSNPNLGPQGRIPPPLTGVGAKLRPKAMRDVLVNGRSVRPYVKTRMPQYGAANVTRLIELFQRVDELPQVEFANFSDLKEIKKTGAELAGSGGLNCIACHTFQQKPAQTMPALDLTEMAARLDKTWFYSYMRSPQRFNPGAVMPSFWPGGKAMRTDVLDGDADLQIEALWQYLLDGRQARTPRGLVLEPIELLATDEAVMLRRSYPGIGKRGIGVGYPNQVNLVFDAEQMRIGMIWKGKFADPSGVWRSQGHGVVRPLGDTPVRFAAGPEFDDAEHPWEVDEGRPPRHYFRGYSLDEQQRPTFLYRFDDIDVEDYPVDVAETTSGVSRIRRTLTFKAEEERDDVAFRAAAGETITPSGEASYLVDRKLRVRIEGDHKGEIVDTAGGKQLRIPLQIAPGTSKLVLEYEW